MKRILLITLFSFLLIVPLAAAQEPNVDSLAVLEVTFWPDFDQPNVLVLVTGTLPPGTEFPATVSIPLSTSAEINAVARVSNDGMFDDIEYINENGILTITTPEEKFLVEYYQPYGVDGDDNIFTFDWSAQDLSVGQIIPRVQQPASASSLSTSPPATDIGPGQFGLTYHEITNQPIPAGEDFSLSFRYPQVEQLSVASLDAEGTVDETAVSAPQTSTTTATEGINWALAVGIIGLILLVAAVTWFFATRKQASRTRKPARTKLANTQKKAATKKFCHNCGEPGTVNDRFCPSCGTKQK